MSSRRTRGRAMIRIMPVLLATLLAGCVAIPSTGAVHAGLPDLAQSEQFYQFTPLGPTANASQEDMVRGFVAAATSSTDDYAVAREFLSTDYASQWDPYSGVLIDEGNRPFVADGTSAGVLSLGATAKVDSNGQMLPVAPGASTDMRFEFSRVNGQWRISSAPNGIILDKSTFMEIWTQHQLYFVGANELLVPTARWFIARAAVATEIVGALLDGPSEGMRESVHSGFPAGTALLNKSVPIVDGRARVDLSSEMLEANAQGIAEVRQQLKLSLQSVPGVNGYDLYVDGSQLRDLGGGIEPQLVNEIGVPEIVVDGQLGMSSGGEFIPSGNFGNSLAALDPEAVSMSYNGAQAAVLNKDGTTLLDENGVVFTDTRARQIAPSIDALGYLWTATDAGELEVTTSEGNALAIPAPWLTGQKVSAVRLAPEGARIAALVTSEQGTRLLVAGVVRDEQGMPVRTTDEADTEMWLKDAPLDFDWVGPSRFAVLTRGDSSTNVSNGGPGLFSADQGSVRGGIQLTGGGARAQLRVLSTTGDLYAPQASGWQRVESDIEVLAKRG